jgi:CMP-N,N'-diacetyllegionaminic acid synthase
VRTVAIIPARSGSQGLPGKNIRLVAGRSLLERAIDFARMLPVDEVIVSTDSEEYARIARSAGATTPGLRGEAASGSNAMEPAVIDDLSQRFREHGIAAPHAAVWIRPTFAFRSLAATLTCIDIVAMAKRSSARVVTEIDPRLYRGGADGRLEPTFPDGGASMVRRQGLAPLYHVFNVEVFRWPSGACPVDYLGHDVGFAVAPKLCAIDIDTAEDAAIAEALLSVLGTGVLP